MSVAEVEVATLDELPPGSMRLVPVGPDVVGVYNCGGHLYAIEDRCSHDDGPLAEGDFDAEAGVAICPRHGSEFDVRTGRPLSLPAYLPVETFEVFVEDGVVKVRV